jgi:hypothetical protein
MPWTRCRETAAALETAIQALDPDRPAVEESARLAAALAQECRDLAAPEVGELATTIERALRFIEEGRVEPHHARWQMAAAIVAIRQAVEHLASGETYAPVALAGAKFELETLFPLPDGRNAGDPPGSVVPAGNLVRKLT